MTWVRRGIVLTAVSVIASSCVWFSSPVTPATADRGAVTNPIRIPRNASRFEIDVVDDSTARFKVWEADWIRPGLVAHVVDPMQRDALVANVRVISVSNGTAVALVTSQVTRMRAEYIVLVTPPPISWWGHKRFWFGAVLGTAIGGVLGANHLF